MLDGVEILHKLKALYSSDDESVDDNGVVDTLIVSGINGIDERNITDDMLIGKQGIMFPRLGKYILYIERDGLGIGIGVAMVLMMIGRVPWERKSFIKEIL